MTQNLFLAIALWGMTFYVLRHTRKIEAMQLALRGLPSPAPASWMGKLLYVVLGLSVASAFFVGSALADGADPFGHVQNVIRSVIQTEAPPALRTPTPTATVYLPTPTSMPTPTPIPTPTLAAVLPSPTPFLQAPGDDDKTPGWMKTPNGQGGGQFQTPPGQGGVPPGQEKKTPEANPESKPTKDNPGGTNGGGNSNSNPNGNIKK